MRHELRVETLIPAPIADVFSFFASAENLQRITPPELDFEIRSPLPIDMKAGATIEYRLKLFGVGFGWRTAITEWTPPVAFTDEQLRGPYKEWIHRHTFEAEVSGTIMGDRVLYRLPLEPIGDLFHPIVRNQLQRIFNYRRRAILDVFRQSAP
jgi:ligand-binding SRPBCC domain-containing protein